MTVTTTLPPGDALTFVTTTETVTGESTAIVFDTVTLQQGVATAYTVIVTGTQTETETLTVDGPPLETHATTTTTTTTETTKTNTDNDDKKRKLTPAEKLKKERTNDSNPDDYWTEGGYRSVERTAEGLVFVIDTKDPPLFQQRVVFACGSNCPTVPSTGYLLAKGVKQSEVLFEAEDIAID